jgi:hypothetical protein
MYEDYTPTKSITSIRTQELVQINENQLNRLRIYMLGDFYSKLQ